MFECEHEVVRKFALETEKPMHSCYPIDIANKWTCVDLIWFKFIL